MICFGAHAVCCFQACTEPGTVWIGKNGNPDTVWSCVKHYEYWEKLQRRIAEQRWMDDNIAYLDPDRSTMESALMETLDTVRVTAFNEDGDARVRMLHEEGDAMKKACEALVKAYKRFHVWDDDIRKYSDKRVPIALVG